MKYAIVGGVVGGRRGFFMGAVLDAAAGRKKHHPRPYKVNGWEDEIEAAEHRKYKELKAAEHRKYKELEAAEHRKYKELKAAEHRKYVEKAWPESDWGFLSDHATESWIDNKFSQNLSDLNTDKMDKNFPAKLFHCGKDRHITSLLIINASPTTIMSGLMESIMLGTDWNTQAFKDWYNKLLAIGATLPSVKELTKLLTPGSRYTQNPDIIVFLAKQGVIDPEQYILEACSRHPDRIADPDMAAITSIIREYQLGDIHLLKKTRKAYDNFRVDSPRNILKDILENIFKNGKLDKESAQYIINDFSLNSFSQLKKEAIDSYNILLSHGARPSWLGDINSYGGLFHGSMHIYVDLLLQNGADSTIIMSGLMESIMLGTHWNTQAFKDWYNKLLAIGATLPSVKELTKLLTPGSRYTQNPDIIVFLAKQGVIDPEQYILEGTSSSTSEIIDSVLSLIEEFKIVNDKTLAQARIYDNRVIHLALSRNLFNKDEEVVNMVYFAVKQSDIFLLETININTRHDNFAELANQQNVHGDTALHLACNSPEQSFVEYLKKAGADINIANLDGVYPNCGVNKVYNWFNSFFSTKVSTKTSVTQNAELPSANTETLPVQISEDEPKPVDVAGEEGHNQTII